MDLSKAFDTINHELLIAKLYAYGFSKDSLKIIFSYLSNRWQRVKINMSFSSWKELIQGVPQGSVLGPLLFNIYLNDLFFIINTYVCNFADDTTPFVCDFELKNVLDKLEINADLAVSWFETNYMKLNPDKCHLLVSGHKYEENFIKINTSTIWESKEVKLLGVKIDNGLKFDNHISDLCMKANRKLSALMRISNFLSKDKRRVIFKAFIESQFKYNPLVWMFHSRQSNSKINRVHERALRTVYNDFESSFEELLEKDGSFCIHHQNIQSLLIEIYKWFNGLQNDVNDIFSISNRSPLQLQIPSINKVWTGENSIRYFGSVIWNSLPIEVRKVNSISLFKSSVKKIKPNCHCRLCKDFIAGVGFVNIV